MGGDPHEQCPVGAAQFLLGLPAGHPRPVGARRGEVLVGRVVGFLAVGEVEDGRDGVDAAEHRLCHLGTIGGGLGEEGPEPGIGDEVVAERRGRAEQGDQPHAEGNVLTQLPVEFAAGFPRLPLRYPVGGVEGLHQPDQGVQREVRVTGAGESPEEVDGLGVHPPEPVEIPRGTGAVEAEARRGGQCSAGRSGVFHAGSGS